MPVPENPALEGLEQKWTGRWEESGVYRFDRSRPRDAVYSIDTPPPTVSGSLHIGHVFSYTHTDLIARYQRMRGKAVFYPMGWDDNGLPTERRVQNYYGVRCDPSLPYDPNFKAPEKPEKHPISVSRPNFVELCNRLTAEDERAFERLWKYLGLSIDWSMTYATIDRNSQSVSQRAFLHLLKRGLAYQVEAPTLWDVDFRTAVAQAELEDREMPGAYHRIRFGGGGPRTIDIETTRPELIPACVALVAHPEDERYKPLFGTEVTTPLFKVRVPVRAHHLADPAKGSGIAMICTFGDVTDVTWWRELALPVRAVIQPDGTLSRNIVFDSHGLWTSEEPGPANESYTRLAGLSASKARTAIVELLRNSGELIGDLRPITHAVKYYEKGDRPLEIVTSRQWFFKTIEFREALFARGRELQWHPAYMQVRYENWAEGLNGDWCVSRQRFFGVPFPVWYPIDVNGRVEYERPIAAPEDALPIDPSTDVPHGFTAAQRGRPGGFVGDPDIMDTWATSSVTPQIVCGWERDADLFAKTFPMDLRPQAHDIIRTWLFDTVLRSHLEHDTLPWKHAALSGFVTDPDRKKMSKSKGNVVTPLGLLEEHGSDGVRYWSACARPGTDTVFDVSQMKVGRRLAMKVLNASKFVLGAAGSDVSDVTTGQIAWSVDRAMLRNLAALVAEATEAFDAYDYARALQRTETFFWRFCDDYLELVKRRAYGDQGLDAAGSANAALTTALSVMLRLFAPFLPFVTEEVWSWWQPGSIHKATWPTVAELAFESTASDSEVYKWATEVVLFEVRKRRSEDKQPLKVPITKVAIKADPASLSHMNELEADLKSALRVQAFECTPAGVGAQTEIVVTGYEPPAS
jgi:valyl-tRNA synthetase